MWLLSASRRAVMIGFPAMYGVAATPRFEIVVGTSVQTNVAILGAPFNYPSSSSQRFLDFSMLSRYNQPAAGSTKGLDGLSEFHVRLRFFYLEPPPTLVARNDCDDPKTPHLFSQGSPHLHDAWLHLHALGCIWNDALCTGTVRLLSETPF
jgi:hypothetical protein